MSESTLPNRLSRVEAALRALAAGEMIVLVDDEDRENEGDLVVAAEKISAEQVNFMLHHARGMLFVAMDGERCDRLELAPQNTRSTAPRGTAYTVTVDATEAFGISTGVSAFDRATTIRRLAHSEARTEDFDRPGHIQPIRARDGGVLVRTGHTEGMTDLCRLAGLVPVAAGIEVMRADGTMARRPDLQAFADEHQLLMLSIADLIDYRRQRERLIERVVTTRLPILDGAEFTVHAYTSLVDSRTHLALVLGTVTPDTPVLVRVHSECLTGDVFGSCRCDCGTQLHAALQQISDAGCGVLLYIRQEGRGIGLLGKLKAYALQDQGLDTVEANAQLGFRPDLREYGIGAQILRDLGVQQMRLLTNNPRKLIGLEGYGLTLVERVPIESTPHPENLRYLQTKRDKLGHLLQMV